MAMVKCRDCRFCEEDYLTTPQGLGIYKFSFCRRLIHDCKLVEPEVGRECADYKKKRRKKNVEKL